MPIPYVTQTWTDGVSSASAARLGVIEQGVKDAHFMPAARVTKAALQAITTATDTAITFDTERFDQASNVADTQHDNSTNPSRLTCRYAGVYLINGCVDWALNATGLRFTEIRLNGSTVIAKVGEPGNATLQTQTVATLWSLAVNDYVELVVNQTSGGSLNVVVTGNTSPEFMWARVG